VDTHKYQHVAVAIDERGARLGELSISADSNGYQQLHDWAQDYGRVKAYGVEGTGSYGVGLAKFLRRAGVRVIEVNRADRKTRYQHGKSDPLDAESAARSVLNGTATNTPKTAEGACEMIRQVKVARDGARKARTAALVALKSMVVTAPSELRESLAGLTTTALVRRCSSYRPGDVDSVHSSTKYSLRSLARRWEYLGEEIVEHDRLLDQLTEQVAPALREGFGIGPDTAAEVLVVFGDNPERVRSEARVREALRRLPHPRLVGSHEQTPALSRRAPPGQRRALSSHRRPNAISRADHRICEPTNPGGTHQKGHHPMPQATARSRDLSTRHDRSSSSDVNCRSGLTG
jgi:transposase